MSEREREREGGGGGGEGGRETNKHLEGQRREKGRWEKEAARLQ